MARIIIVIAAAICLSVAATMMRDRDARIMELTRLPSKNASLRTEPIKMLLASPEVRLVMRADHVDKYKLLAELNAISAQRQSRLLVLAPKSIKRVPAFCPNGSHRAALR